MALVTSSKERPIRRLARPSPPLRLLSISRSMAMVVEPLKLVCVVDQLGLTQTQAITLAQNGLNPLLQSSAVMKRAVG